ncbi:polyphenol oxidase [Brevirhabdus pacifica]|uniref:Purine nucleoside phosphorylase n=1 Tax=Brevirhabdus pacifica TaxID=1267768 RepID=A0A1U7DK45_9RHOB|nr:peptidoglycan editing factor PgeF [Brevirhabdus pacifica]APX90387.1 polyphenol oxidase [Brevirhabdus pacifica]OWU78588.1 polyphenol oxidase [Loktanella sp. 22II-4b]PJJ85525.1 hypothetical protein CLV77_2395 [Brevirhabdus pacifica]
MTLHILTNDLLMPLAHGFFTRRGGASTGIYAELNGGAGSSDQAHVVSLNRARVAEALDLAPASLFSVHQYHSAEVFVLDGEPPAEKPRADAIVTRQPGYALTILTADCQPVLFADHEAQVIGAAHAGWQGALGGVLEATIDRMVELGAQRERIVAAIGPSISQKNYEVGPDFMERFLDDDPENQRFFAQGKGDRVQFDLPGYGLHRLRSAGIRDAEWIRHCTYEDPGAFYSYRRSVHLNEADYGRLMSSIRL